MHWKKLRKMQPDETTDTKEKRKQISGDTFLTKALSIFPLNRRVESTTEQAWEIYTANRLAAENKFPGPEKISQSPSGEEDGEDQSDLEDDRWRFDDEGEKFILKLIRQNMNELENEMCLDKGVLQQCFRLISCDALFESQDSPCNVTALTRIYSPTLPVYIDVHFQYRYRSDDDAIEWFYNLGFKVHKHPRANDYNPPEIKKFEEGRFDGAYTSNGWRPVAFGFYDVCGENRRRWRKIECASFQLTEEGVKEVYEALWGQQEEDLHDEEEDMDTDMHARRKTLVDTVRVLLAAVGIGYDIAVDEEEEDQPSRAFALEGLNDHWFARGVRAACGFQLEGDPEDAISGQKERDDEARKSSCDSEYNSEGWQVCDDDSSDSDF